MGRVQKIKDKSINKFLTEIGWREFNHALINYFPHMLVSNDPKNLRISWQKNSKFLCMESWTNRLSNS